ncbi:unnamed protein product [Adineta ricciae]|uniref:Uncharacterized protein n=1 Tax=Adineta ricciae TaxID=249248 RepID=A0A815MJZ3_ADIRI|nr:unnamed protein product [Adineta ricciae]
MNIANVHFHVQLPRRKRSTSELAKSIGLPEDELIECRHIKPQRAALAVFNKLYATHRERAKLISIKKFARGNTQLLNDILQFARQCNPSVIFTTEKIREALGGSIRQSKHHVNKFMSVDLNLVGVNEQEMTDRNGVELGSSSNMSVVDAHSENLTDKYLNQNSIAEFDQMDEQ